MKKLKVALSILVMFVLALLSVPFIIIAAGYVGIGDEEGSDKWYGRAPLTLWLDFVEKKR